MFKLCFYVPESHLESVKLAVFDAGAGRIGNYEQCCWQIEGRGQFRPLPGASPAIGVVDRLESVVEYRVEMLCAEACLKNVVEALILAHPYEEPAYDVIQILDL
ncbi:MAG: YqfO family protein [Pseudohongiella sp.]|nr:YqfO family protein [Pseudohongiella sp.]